VNIVDFLLWFLLIFVRPWNVLGHGVADQGNVCSGSSKTRDCHVFLYISFTYENFI